MFWVNLQVYMRFNLCTTPHRWPDRMFVIETRQTFFSCCIIFTNDKVSIYMYGYGNEYVTKVNK